MEEILNENAGRLHPSQESDAEAVQDATGAMDFTEQDIRDFGEIIGEKITAALSDILGNEEADRICTEIAEEARNTDRSIQDIIADKVSPYVDLQPEDIERFADAASEPPQSRYDMLKERYDAVKDKYLFRNTFVLLDRLELNVEAYKTGQAGDRGKPVSGGDIAMNIVELTRSNVWESLLEIAVRSYFDEKYPAKVDTGTAAEERAVLETAATADRPDLIRDMSGTVRDDGLVTGRNVDLQALGIDKRNPMAGQYMGVDMTKSPDSRDLSMEVWRSGRGLTDTVTIGGQTERLFIPDMRLVEFNHDHYLVDPFGKVVAHDTDSSSGKDVTTYFRSLDISTYRANEPRMEAAAAGKGITVDEYKAQVADTVKDNFVSRLTTGFEKHTEYLRELLPDIKGTVDAYKEKVEQLAAAETKLQATIDTSSDTLEKSSADPSDTTWAKQLEAVTEVKEKLNSAIDRMESRMDKIEATMEGYARARAVVASGKTDVDASLAAVVHAEMTAVGRTGNEDYGISKEDLQQITETLSAIVELDADPVDTGTEPKPSPDTVIDSPKGTDVDYSGDTVTPEPVDSSANTEHGPAVSNDNFPQSNAEWVSDTTDTVLDREGNMDAYHPSAYDGPVPADVEDWKVAQLEHYRECIYEFQTEGYLEKESLLEQIKDMGYAELDNQPNWLLQNLGADVDDLLSDYRGMQDTIERIDNRMEAADRYLELLDNSQLSPDEKLAAFDHAAERMGLSEETQEAMRIPMPDIGDSGDVSTGDFIPDTNAPVDTSNAQDDAAIVAEESTDTPVTYEDIKDALDRFLSQGADGTFSFQEDFLDLHKGDLSESDLYNAFSDKVKEIESDVKDADSEVDSNVLDRLSDVFGAIEDSAISSVTYQAEHLSDLVDAICSGDTESVGNLLMEDYFNKVEAQLEPLERIADYLNEKFDPDWQADAESIKEAVCERLSDIHNETLVDRVCGIAETLNDIFHGFDVMLTHIADSYVTGAETEGLPDVVTPDVDIAVPDIPDTELPDATETDISAEDIEPDFDLAHHVESLRDFLSDVESLGATAESAATAEELEAALAAL